VVDTDSCETRQVSYQEKEGTAYPFGASQFTLGFLGIFFFVGIRVVQPFSFLCCGFGGIRVVQSFSFLCCGFGGIRVIQSFSFLCCGFGGIRVVQPISFLCCGFFFCLSSFCVFYTMLPMSPNRPSGFL
jgi:hypothetical protein